MKKLILIILTIAAITAGCIKYEEGPCMSMLSVEDRLFGDYDVSVYTVNGIDSISNLQNRFGLKFHFYFNNQSSANNLKIDGNNSPSPFIGRYVFINHYKEIEVTYGSIILTGYGNADIDDIIFKILKLKKSDVHLETAYKGSTYNIKLK